MKKITFFLCLVMTLFVFSASSKIIFLCSETQAYCLIAGQNDTPGKMFANSDQSVDFHQFDDITTQPLPESLTVLLLGSSIIGVIIARKKTS